MTSDYRVAHAIRSRSAFLSAKPQSSENDDGEPPATDGGEHGFMHVRWTGGDAVVVLSGDVDLTCGPRAEEVHQLLREWAQRAVVDASGVTFMDLRGLDAVCALAHADEPVLLLRPSSCVLRLLEVLSSAGCGPVVRVLEDQGGVVVLSRGTGADARR